MVKNSNTSYENEIQDSPSYEDSNNIMLFSRKALISEEGRLENLGKWPTTGESIVM